MNVQALCHIPYSNYAYAINDNTIQIRLRTAKGDLKKVILCYGCKFDWSEESKKRFEMKKEYSDEYFDYYIHNIVEDDSRIGYYFELIDNSGNFSIYSEIGMLDEFDDSQAYCTFFHYPMINESDIHRTPSWLYDTVFYQIFVERFAKGKNNSEDRDYLVSWDSKPTPTSFYGGNLQGIIDKIDYLADLGINAVYLTPVFSSESNHKYDTNDYMKVDKYFGDKDTLKKLVEHAHKRDIRVMLDAVFNHCSMNISFFQDVINNADSLYKDWFCIENFPVDTEKMNYKVFSFCNYMPKLNTSNPEVKKYLIDVAKYWTNECNIDGWRLDVADEVDKDFWRDFRKAIKTINKDIAIIGESWHTSLEYLRGDMYDSVMNYPVTKLALDYFARKKIDASKFEYGLSRHLMQYSDNVNYSMLNLLDSHDTERFLTTTKNDENKLLAAVTFLFGYVGMPCIYYGSEIGMDGEYDPGCRKGFEWDSSKWNKKIFEYYKKIIDIRKKEEVLKKGDIKFVYDKKAFIMIRSYNNEKIIILCNNTDKNVEVSLAKYKKKDGSIIELIANRCLLKDNKVVIKPDGSGFYKL